MKHSVKIVLLSITLSLLGGYALCAWVYFAAAKPSITCKQLHVQIADSTSHYYVSSAELIQLLKTTGIHPVGHDFQDISCRTIEQTLEEHPMLRRAECHKTPTGNVYVRVWQRTPVLRVMATENYFVDTERRIMPVRSMGIARTGQRSVSTATHVPIVTGNLSKRMAQEELYDFIQWTTHTRYSGLLKSEVGGNYWADQIQQIHVASPHNIVLTMRRGNARILIGDLVNFEAKLDKLHKLYTDGFDRIGWQQYREIDLRYKGQVVCRR